MNFITSSHSFHLISVICLNDGITHHVKSPQYPSNYPNNAYAIWNIKAPNDLAIIVIALNFDTEEKFDYVYISDSPTKFSVNSWVRWTGQMKLRYTILQSSSAAIIFTSDQETTEKGFHLLLQAIYQNENQSKSCYLYIHKHFPVLNFVH